MKYSLALARKIAECFASGEHTVADVCKQCDVSETSFYDWKATKPEFSEMLKKADEQRLAALGRMARSGLAKLLDVYEFEETTTEFGLDKEGKPRQKSRKVTKKQIMPNAAAIIYTLNNRAPEDWQQRKHVELSGKVDTGRPDLSSLSDEELAQYMALAAKTRPAAPNESGT
jgi:hypothetical protein